MAPIKVTPTVFEDAKQLIAGGATYKRVGSVLGLNPQTVALVARSESYDRYLESRKRESVRRHGATKARKERVAHSTQTDPGTTYVFPKYEPREVTLAEFRDDVYDVLRVMSFKQERMGKALEEILKVLQEREPEERRHIALRAMDILTGKSR